MGSSSSKQLSGPPIPSPGIAVLDGHQANGRTTLRLKKSTFRPHMKNVVVSRGSEKLYVIQDQFIGIGRKGYRQKNIKDLRSGKQIATVGVDKGFNVTRCTCYLGKDRKRPLFTLARGENNTYIATPCQLIVSAVDGTPKIRASFKPGAVYCGPFRVGQFFKGGLVVEQGMDQLVLIIMKVMMSTVKTLKHLTKAMTYAAPGGGRTGRALGYAVTTLNDDSHGRRIAQDGDDSAYGYYGTGYSEQELRGRARDEATAHVRAKVNKRRVGRVDSGYSSASGGQSMGGRHSEPMEIPLNKRELNAMAKAKIKAEAKAKVKSHVRAQLRGGRGRR